jgi:mannose-6-phosphate isomerase-like protein (cupin superfamily)
MEAVSRKNAERYSWGGNCEGWHLLRTPELSIIQERVPPGGAETRHRHGKARQFFFVISGEAVMELDGRDMTLAPGEGLEVPPGVPHRLLNRGARELLFLVVSAPPSHGDRIDSPRSG